MRKFTAAALATASLLPLATSAFAQDAAVDEGVSDGEEIIVQARRKDESIQDVPLSVQAVTGADLQRLEIRQFQDISKVVPGLTLSQDGVATSAALRGVNFDARASGASTTVEFYRNDAVTTGGALFQAVYDIGQIEVLRGPQGTLRGRASPSGSITITTRRPDLSEAGGYVSGSYGNQHKWNFNAAVNIPVIADKLAVRVAGFIGGTRGNDINGLNVGRGTIDSNIYDRNESLRASVRADPFDGVLVLDFNFETIHNARRQFSQVESLNVFQPINPATGVANPASPRTITADDRLGVGAIASPSDTTYKIYNWQAKLRQWGQSLTYVGSRVSNGSLGFGYGDPAGLFSSPFAIAQTSAVPAGVGTNQLGQITDSRSTQTTHELRLQNEDRIAGLFDYVVGAFKVSAATPTILTNTSPTSISGVSPDQFINDLSYRGTLRFRRDSESSLFGNLTVHLGESTELSGGLRHIWFKADSGVTSGISFLDPFNTGTTIQRRCYGNSTVPGCLPTKEATIYAASLKHKFNDDILGYFSFGTSWRPGNSLVGWGLQNPGTTLTYGSFIDQYLNLPDETSKSFEIGFKTSWLDRRLRFNVSAFYQKFNNYPLYGSTSVQSLNQPTQAGSTLLRPFNFAAPVAATIKGVETEFSFDVTPNFYLAASMAFADSKVRGAVVPCVDTDNNNVQDSASLNSGTVIGVGGATQATIDRYNLWLTQIGTNQVDTCTLNASPNSQPRFSGTVQAEYKHAVRFGEAYLRGFVSWKGASAGDAVNPNDQVGAYALVDLFGGFRDPKGGWEAGLFVKNLFDTQRVLSRASGVGTSPINGVGGSATNNYLQISRNDPREVGLSVRFAFGSR